MHSVNSNITLDIPSEVMNSTDICADDNSIEQQIESNDGKNGEQQIDEMNCLVAVRKVQRPPLTLHDTIENPDYSWMRRLLQLQKKYILKVNQTQYEV